MHSISPARALARQARQLVIAGAVVAMIGLVLAALGLLLIVIPVARAGWYSTIQLLLIVGGGVMILVGIGLAIRGLTIPPDNQSARIMADILARGLDYRYTFIRHIHRRDFGYIDAILVGPNGALVFFFFEKKGNFVCEAGQWLRQEGRALAVVTPNPSHEVVQDVTALRAYLAARGLAQVPVYAVVVVSNRETVVSAEQPVVPVAHMHNVLAVLRDNYLAAERIPVELARATVDAIMMTRP